MWMTNGVHVVDRLSWVMASQALSVSASIGNAGALPGRGRLRHGLHPVQERYWAGRGGGRRIRRWGDPTHECQVICANGTLRFNQHGADGKYVRVGRGDRWEDVPFEDTPHEMHNEWKGFVEAIESGIEPPAHGEYGRHIMEILFAAEKSAITGRDVLLDSGLGWSHQASGSPTTIEHGWI